MSETNKDKKPDRILLSLFAHRFMAVAEVRLMRRRFVPDHASKVNLF